ncbi:MAG: tRNA (adenosine(37)-N6)-threonylcarbamoyltransferase complex dimerization subunit type 1 TsaB [Deltaproteobacteria bacterium]|nr:tRNA (adenosine(37)-N6)-threonylcarbamoyltransferase complex dimerization subunit type 1 TsaB [Deltaproteobacteria bacterium]
MSVLLLDTSCSSATLALIHEDGRLLAECTLSEMRRHAESLADATDELFRQVDLDFSSLSAIGVGAGPGSFVGVRVGLSTTKGWAMGAGVPLVGIEGLFALAQAAPVDAKWVLSCIDARRGELYCALYERVAVTTEGTAKLDEGVLVERQPAAARSPVDIVALVGELPAVEQELVLVGSGLDLLDDVSAAKKMELQGPSGAMLSAAFFKATEKGVVDTKKTLVPRYLRKPDAKRPVLRERPKGA